MTFDIKAFTDEVRKSVPIFRGKVSKTNYTGLVKAVDAGLGKVIVPIKNINFNLTEPKWLQIARTKIGRKEIVGRRHNSWIAKGWKRLGVGWFNDDETPWCGFFVADCLNDVGLSYPKMFPRAKSFASWGKASTPCLGAIVVFGRKGGGHVGYLVGENDKSYYVLGGNQKNMVSITPILKSRAIATRWPSTISNPDIDLPQMSGGTISRNEA